MSNVELRPLFSGGNARTVAHEIGHAAGLKDIYVEGESMNADGSITSVYLANDPVKKVWEPRDWNSGPEPEYYNESLTQPGLVQRLLMYGEGSDTKADIPSGQVHGLYKPSYAAGLVKVGLQDMTRTPTSW
jgi:hypothetical protein